MKRIVLLALCALPAAGAGTNLFYVPENPAYTIVDSALDSIRFTLGRTVKSDARGHLVPVSSFVDPEGAVMGWHDFGNLQGCGGQRAVGSAVELIAVPGGYSSRSR